MNELSQLCEATGADIEEVRRGMSGDARIGRHFLYAGVGYGGSCFPKDVQALMHTARAHDVMLGLVAATHQANLRQHIHFVRRVQGVLGQNLDGKTLAVWGLAFKPNTDDMRDAPSITILRALKAAGARIQAFDPVAMDTARTVLGEAIDQYGPKRDDVLQGADALLVLTEWNEFRNPDWDLIKKSLKQPLVFDGRNLYSLAEMASRKVAYFSMGRPTVDS
jgi:UDPglucose 6-dehydrogenase